MKEKVTEIKRKYVSLLFETLYKWLIEKRVIRKQHIMDYRSVCINLLMDNVKEKKEVSDELEEFYYKLQMYSGDYLDSDEKLQAFRLGELISVYETYKQHAEVQEQDKREAEIISRYQNGRIRQILMHMARSENGLRHKELAEKCGITPSQLTQILGRFREDRTFYSIQRGREKYYILTSLGKDIYHRVCSKADQYIYLNASYADLSENYYFYFSENAKHPNQTLKEKNSISNDSNEEWMSDAAEMIRAAASEGKRKRAAVSC